MASSAIELTHQASICLRGDWAACDRYRGASKPAATAPPAPGARWRRPGRLIAGTFTVLGGLLVASLLLGSWLPSEPAPPPVRQVAAATARATQAVTAGTIQRIVAQATGMARPTMGLNATPSQVPTNTPAATVAQPATVTATRTPSPTSSPTMTASASATALPSPTASATPGASGALWTAVHVVQEGETVAEIAGRYGSAVDDLVTVSGLDDRDLIYAGQVLTVPLQSAAAALSTTPVLSGTGELVTGAVAYAYPAPLLIEPGQGTAQGGRVALTWQWEPRLKPGEFFAVLVWYEAQPAPCMLHFSVERTCVLAIEGRAPGIYHWTVRVVQGSQVPPRKILKRCLSPEGERREFTWQGTEW